MSNPWGDTWGDDAPDEPFSLPPADADTEPEPHGGETTETDPVAAFDARVAVLEGTVADLVDAMTLTPGGPWVWHQLDDDTRRKLATDLVGWVEWLSTRYLAHMSQDVLKLPANWYTNPVVVDLFTALYVGYLSVYNSRQRIPSMALIEWHERGLWPTLDRLKTLKLITGQQGLYTTTYPINTDLDAVDALSRASPGAEGGPPTPASPASPT